MSSHGTISPQSPDGAIALRPCGALDVFAAERFAANVSDVVRATPATVLVDLSGLVSIDAAGIHHLLRARTTAAAREVRLVLSDPSDAVRRVLTVSGVDRLFEIDPATADGDGLGARPIR
jgi:anti-sigma B factor antagonist